MISIVVVSHSLKLAEGVLELAAQMTHGRIKLVCAAGIDDPQNPIGTDSMAVFNAIESVYSKAGVLVLVDMGSAILSTDMALELLGNAKAANVCVTAAPIVEGTIAASVAAASGLSMREVIEESRLAIQTKYKQLGEPLEFGIPSNYSDPDNVTSSAPSFSFTTEIQNPNGIHARPASAIVSAVARYDAVITLKNGNNEVNAKSINSIALLGAKFGDSIVCVASGKEASAAIKAYEILALNHFNEDITQSVAISTCNESEEHQQNTKDGLLIGTPASKGIAIAPICHFQTSMPQPSHRKSLGFESESQEYQRAKERATEDLKLLTAKTVEEGAKDQAEIFNAHIQMLDDPYIENQLSELLENGVDVETAWETIIAKTAKAYESSSSKYMQERANDILDIGKRVMLLLLGVEDAKLDFSSPIILVADDLTPSDTAQLDPAIVKGLILLKGGHTSHSAILARSLGIPAIVGVSSIAPLANDEVVILDGDNGKILLKPDGKLIEKYKAKIEFNMKAQLQATKLAKQKAYTLDKTTIDIFANVATLKDVDDALSGGAEGVGLLRSEFLFMDRSDMPSEDSQCEFYSQVASAFKAQPVIIRTLDIGGDKPLKYLQQSVEENPFLGSRGIRLCLRNEDVFKTQLKALLRATALNRNIQVMFPMIATLDELKEAKSLLSVCHKELKAIGQPSEIPKVGIMIELPSAVVNADKLAKESDFFSIGTNDLTQYVMAADRGNELVSHLVSGAQPAVLKMIAMTSTAAKEAGIPVGICGELAGDERFTELFIGLDIDELSMSPIRVANIKQTVRAVDKQKATTKAMDIIEQDNVTKVLSML